MTKKNAESVIADYKIKWEQLEQRMKSAGDAELKIMKLQEELLLEMDSINKWKKSIEETVDKLRQDRQSIIVAQADIEKKEKSFVKREQQVEFENKKIQLAWLTVNKRIQEKQVDIDIKKLQEVTP
jgi:hypothetical protein